LLEIAPRANSNHIPDGTLVGDRNARPQTGQKRQRQSRQ